MVRRVWLVALLATLVVGAALGPPGSAQSTYSISIDESITTPEKDVTVDGSTYTVDSVVGIDHGSSFTARVDAPEETYDLYLYNADRQIVQTKRMTGSGSATFETDSLEVGSYVLAVYGPDGNFRDVHPVVVEGYDVSQSAPDAVENGDGGTISVSLNEIATSPDPSYVEVVLMEGSSLVSRLDATESGGSYDATIPETLDTGSYTYYAVVHGPETVNGRKEIIALGAKSSLTVESAQTTQSSSGGQSSGGETTSESPTTTTSTPSTATATPTTTQSTATETSTAETTEATTSTTPTSESTEQTTALPTSETTDSGVITPATTTPETTTSQQTLPARGPALLAMLLLLGGFALRRR
jgi:hypothetical protein